MEILDSIQKSISGFDVLALVLIWVAYKIARKYGIKITFIKEPILAISMRKRDENAMARKVVYLCLFALLSICGMTLLRVLIDSLGLEGYPFVARAIVRDGKDAYSVLLFWASLVNESVLMSLTLGIAFFAQRVFATSLSFVPIAIISLFSSIVVSYAMAFGHYSHTIYEPVFETKIMEANAKATNTTDKIRKDLHK